MVQLACYLLFTTGCLVTGLRDVHITVPKAVRRGDSVLLHCHYDLEGDPLYALKWYKGRAEFYRYTPNEKPPTKVFQIPGLSELNVDKSQSNGSQLFLRQVTSSLSGQFNCEVSADAPSFHTAIVAANMDVVEVPRNPPELSGIKSKYRVRDTLRANCTASPSKPAVNLTWGINGENVNPKYVKQYRQVPERYPDLQQSMSILEVPLKAHHFVPGGRLKVRCTASLYDLYWQTTEKGADEEGRPTDKMAADKAYNEVKANWDDYEDDEYGDQNNFIIGAFPTPPSDNDLRNSAPFVSSTFVLIAIALLRL
ncbi:uncharacterized protein LOC128988109 isoform X1 [Macrosteles quadrilineatus]|uniref:uncharacterized protein LOC128988109 isoform X1 n=1 Tax=Macrosteles quadrilineatus TaxID=74068 RepID=UPI0023E30B2E|nr:uncharacterized protein LOC128988109 isoform X1 [Macrosteles quadrilineatus]